MRSNVIFFVWGMLVLAAVLLLTFLGFRLKAFNKSYLELENKLFLSAEKYINYKGLQVEKGDTVKVTSEELIANEFLDELKHDDEMCSGYVLVKFDKVYSYETYIKCLEYTTRGYQK